VTKCSKKDSSSKVGFKTERSTPTKIKLSHQGEIKLVLGWGTTPPERRMKVINVAEGKQKY
jgi:hypothetical protein